MSALDRTRRSRDRQRKGKVVLFVEVDETEIADALIEGGWLDPNLSDSREALQQAFSACTIRVLPRAS